MHAIAPALDVQAPAFADPVHDAQQVFRTLLAALAEPGRALPLPRRADAAERVGLCPALAAMVLTLADNDTPVHWPRLQPAAVAWLRFHVGAPLVDAPGAAQFVVAHALPTDLAPFARGTDEAPERSATLLVRLARLDGGPAMRWRGPGIERERAVALPAPGAFWAAWSAQHACFPLGVDIIATDGAYVMALPRTTYVAHAGAG
jgi:alpha-D-ribose 1-methylphosphonate 5-triphosphate synthase subunit PhnH